jgi:hypothetical protein
MAVFDSDIEANKWRSALFQSMQPLVLPKFPRQSKPGEPEPGIVRFFNENCQDVERRILDLVQAATGRAAPVAVQQEVRKIPRLAGELAITLGAQRARIHLAGAQRGDVVRQDGTFDVQNGGSRGGARAELLLSPGLVKIGDGRGDMETRRVLLSGEIFAMGP